MKPAVLFHISEENAIKTFVPRPSPAYFETITGDVVFAISKRLVHNYMLPRDCPRVTFYITADTLSSDREKFFEQSTAGFVIAIEAKWLQAIQDIKLYCYTFSSHKFILLDENAGYYISYEEIEPISISCIDNPLKALQKKGNIELRVLPTLWNLADEVVRSSLGFSLIRMRNAIKRNSDTPQAF